MVLTSLTIIVPTFGRSSLKALVPSITEQLGPDDQFIVALDGPNDWVPDFVAGFPQVELVQLPERTHDYGCTPNDVATETARGDAIWYLGDDDAYPGAVEIIRDKFVPDRLNIFSMSHTGRILQNEIREGGVSSQQVVVPRLENPPQWRDYPEGKVMISDFFWADAMRRRLGEPAYHDEVICVMQHQNYGKEF